MSTVSGALGGAGNLVGGTVQTAAQAAAPSLSKISNPLDGIERTVREQSAGQDPQAARDAAYSAFTDLYRQSSEMADEMRVCLPKG